MRVSDLVEMDGNGNLVVGDEPSEATGFFIYWRIQTQCAHAKATLHTHMPYATEFSALEGGRLEPVFQATLKFHNRIAYDDAYNGLPLDGTEGDRLAGALADRRIAVLANQGLSSPAQRWPMRSTIFTIWNAPPKLRSWRIQAAGLSSAFHNRFARRHFNKCRPAATTRSPASWPRSRACWTKKSPIIRIDEAA